MTQKVPENTYSGVIITIYRSAQINIGFRRWVGYYGGSFAVRVNRLCRVKIMVYEGPNSRDRCMETRKVVVCCLYGQISDISLSTLDIRSLSGNSWRRLRIVSWRPVDDANDLCGDISWKSRKGMLTHRLLIGSVP
ncbi:hypothetical protein ACTXT7_009178 [Hymenolepis weldensis]